MYEEFLSHRGMSGIRERAVWVHVDVPGQGKYQTDLPTEYVLVTNTPHAPLLGAIIIVYAARGIRQ